MKKQSSILFVILLFSLVFCACNKEKEKIVLINFINLTGSKIDNATINGKVINDIQNNEETGFIKFSTVNSFSSILNFSMVIEQQGQIIEQLPIYYCGNGAIEQSTSNSGRYNIEIRIEQNSNKQFFKLYFR